MKAEERRIAEILNEQIRYEIPAYQRPYSWERANVSQLLLDLWEAYEAKDPEYFIGSLITIEREPNERYDIVDGQQRMTTLNLIFARLRDAIQHQAAKAELGNRILPRNVLTSKAETPRLTLRAKDQTFFREHVLEGREITRPREALDAPKLRITENLEAIDEFIAGKDDQTLMLFADYVLRNVYVVFVKTNSWDSAYRLFNVLNARGMSLSNADLIKNTLFSKLGHEAHRADELEERWSDLEDEVGIDRLDAFFSHHRTTLLASRASRKLHEEFKAIIELSQASPFEFLRIAQNSAENFMRIRNVEFADPATKRSLTAALRVEYDEWIPALLAFLNRPVAGFPESEFVELVEKITMQNWVRRLGRTARLTVYYQLINAINDGKSADDVRAIFTRAAANDDFLKLLDGDVYGAPFDTAVMLRLEEAAQDISVTKSYGGRLTIEHILPRAHQKEAYWTDRFNADQHRQWLNRLGNLAMLAGYKNSKAQTHDFGRKKKAYNDRSKLVSFDLTKEVCVLGDWTVEELGSRQQRLMDLAAKTWTI